MLLLRHSTTQQNTQETHTADKGAQTHTVQRLLTPERQIYTVAPKCVWKAATRAAGGENC